MSLSKMAERKDDLHWLDIEEQAVEALLGNVHSAQLRRPLRPFVVLTLDTMDFACWLLGVNAADAKMPASLTRGAGEEEEEGDDGSPLSIPRGVSCLLDESGYDHLITFGILLLGGAATAAAGGSPLALASMGAWIPAWMQNVPVATNVLAGVTLASYGLNWLTEERLEDAPRWFIRLCSANLLIAGLFHLGMGAVLFGSVGSWHIPAEIMLLIKSHAGVQLFAPYYAIQDGDHASGCDLHDQLRQVRCVQSASSFAICGPCHVLLCDPIRCRSMGGVLRIGMHLVLYRSQGAAAGRNGNAASMESAHGQALRRGTACLQVLRRILVLDGRCPGGHHQRWRWRSRPVRFLPCGLCTDYCSRPGWYNTPVVEGLAEAQGDSCHPEPNQPPDRQVCR